MTKKDSSLKVLGLDISTKTIGWALFDMSNRQLLELTHFTPKLKPKPEDKVEEHLLKATAFGEKLKEFKGLGIVDVIAESDSITLKTEEIKEEVSNAIEP